MIADRDRLAAAARKRLRHEQLHAATLVVRLCSDRDQMAANARRVVRRERLLTATVERCGRHGACIVDARDLRPARRVG